MDDTVTLADLLAEVRALEARVRALETRFYPPHPFMPHSVNPTMPPYVVTYGANFSGAAQGPAVGSIVQLTVGDMKPAAPIPFDYQPEASDCLARYGA